jgi:hypothetical protein
MPPPTAYAIVWLVVVYHRRVAATQARCSAHLPIFRWVPFWRPKQGIQPQQARTLAPAAYIRLIGSYGAVIRVHGGCCHGE